MVFAELVSDGQPLEERCCCEHTQEAKLLRIEIASCVCVGFEEFVVLVVVVVLVIVLHHALLLDVSWLLFVESEKPDKKLEEGFPDFVNISIIQRLFPILGLISVLFNATVQLFVQIKREIREVFVNFLLG